MGRAIVNQLDLTTFLLSLYHHHQQIVYSDGGKMALSRQEMIEKLMWNTGGYGFGICSVAGSMLWAMQTPSKNNPDLKSVVAVSGPAEKYTDDELAELVSFSEKKTADYDKMFRYRMGANLVIIDKQSNDRWIRKRLTWTTGIMWSPTLKEALAVMN